MRNHRLFSFLPILFALSTACSDKTDDSGGGVGDGGEEERWEGEGEAGDFDFTLDIDGIERDFVLYAPDSAVDEMTDRAVPLLFGLHGAGDTGENFITATKLTETAEDNGFLIVGPDALQRAWFWSTNEGWDSPDGNSSSLQNDLAFMLAIIDELSVDYHIDEDRIFTVGFSRGAGMSGALATSSGQIETSAGTYVSPFAAHSVNAGFDVYGGGLDLEATEPKNPVWIIHGDADTAVPYSYGETFAEDLEDAGWDVTFTTIDGASHNWLYQVGYGQDNQDLWDWFIDVAR